MQPEQFEAGCAAGKGGAGAEAVPFDRARLRDYLLQAGFRLDGAAPVKRLSGGLANLNYLVRVDGQPMVLRRPPPGDLPPGAHDMRREHLVLSRLSRVLSFVPRGLHYCADPAVIGAPFQLIEFREGLGLRGSDLGPFTGRPEIAARLSAMLVETLADIHAVDAAAAGLGDLGRPQGFLPRAVQGWNTRGRRIATGSAARLVQEIGGWLERQRFAGRPPTLLHCDFKLDNILLDPATLKPAAVLDWDMGTRGDPLFDLATMLSYWAQPGDPDCMRELDQMATLQPGFWSREEVAEAYARRTGRDVSDLPAIRVLAMFKLGVVFLQLHERGLVENDPRYANFADLGEDVLLFARDVAQGDAI